MRLHHDILANVLDCLYSPDLDKQQARADLAACALVSRQFHSLCAPLLYSKVRLEKAEEAIHFLSSTPRLLALVKDLALEVITYDYKIESQLYRAMLDALSHMSGLQRISFAPVPSRFVGKILTALSTCGPQLKSGTYDIEM